MARAKRTDRTDARRRHRAEQAALTVEPTGDGASASASTSASTSGQAVRPAKGSASPSAPAQPRPSIMAAFRGAIHPLTLRSDLRAAPRVLLHWAVLAAIAVAVVSSVVFVVSTNDIAAAADWSKADPLVGVTIPPVSNISWLAVSLFVAVPPAAGAFLIGFTANRASWLGGLVFGIVATVCFIAMLQTPAGHFLYGNGSKEAAAINALAVSPVFSALLASLAAWYRRFLALANPNRNQRQQAARKPSGRGDMKPARH